MSKKQVATKSHTSKTVIHSRFSSPRKGRKLGFFQKAYQVASAKPQSPREVAEKLMKFKSKPAKYTDVEQMEKQVVFYVKRVWGRAGLLKLDESGQIVKQ